MIGKNIFTCSFSRKDMSITMASKSSVKVGGEDVQIDPNLLFQRLAALSNGEDAKKDIFSFELCSFPASLFESALLPRLAHKAALAEHLWTLLSDQNVKDTKFELSEEFIRFVIDGGALLHKLTWLKNVSYNSLCSLYT